MEIVEKINGALNGFVWGPVMIVVLVGIGIYFTVKTRFLQLTKFGLMLKTTVGSAFSKKDKARAKGTITPFQAMTTALAGTIGTGNIAGVATAIVSGGPGAVFWMWVSSFFGMITKYAEVALAIRYREKKENGEYVGGPMYYIQKGLHMKWLAVVFAVFCVLASFGIGNMTQSNSIAEALYSSFGVEKWLSGVVACIIVGLVIIGGITRIAKVTEKFVPVMGIFYVIGAVAVLCINADAVPAAFKLIFTEAFNMQAVGGGIFGYVMMNAIRFGFSRGVFSNEAGLGSAPIAHAAATTDSPVKQGLWGIFEVFFDTIVMCTLTTLVILTSGLWTTGLDGAALTAASFGSTMGSFAQYFISISTVFFAISTIISWSYYGERCIEYLFKRPTCILLYRMCFIFSIVVGATTNLTLVWSIADTLNGFMAIPNLIALIGLSGVVVKMTREHFDTEHDKYQKAVKKYRKK